MIGLTEDVKVIKNKSTNLEITTNQLIQSNERIIKDFAAIQKKSLDLEKENNTLRKQVTSLIREVEYLDTNERRNNIIIYNLSTPAKTDEELMSAVLEIFVKAKVNIHRDNIDSLKLIGRSNGTKHNHSNGYKLYI